MISFRVYSGTDPIRIGSGPDSTEKDWQRPMPDGTHVRLPMIDGFQFARTGQDLRGRCAVSTFERLRDVLSSSAGELDYEVAGTKDDMGRPALRLKLSGLLHLTCQRCLKAMPFSLAVDAMLILAGSEAEVEAQPLAPEGPDRVVGSREMPVETLLEDEALLEIPFAPRHEECAAAGAGKGEAQGSPFADLRGLLNRGGRAGN